MKLLSRLRAYAALDEADFSPLSSIALEPVRWQKGAAIISVGDTLKSVFVMEAGWAIRYRTLPDGRRQLLNFMLPGDCFDLQVFTNTRADHSIQAVTEVHALSAKRTDFINAMRSNARLATAFWWSAVQEESILREHIVRLGRRSAPERLAHLLLELHRRLKLVGIENGDIVHLPITREMLADALGLSTMHLSRSISHLQQNGMIELRDGAILLSSPQKLTQFAQFDASYLHASRLLI